MIFLVRADRHIENNQEFKDEIQAQVEAILLPRYGDQVRRVEVYLEDANGFKEGGHDKRCGVEVHLSGHPAVVAEARAAIVEQAVRGALEKVLRGIDRSIGRLRDRDDTISMSGQAT